MRVEKVNLDTLAAIIAITAAVFTAVKVLSRLREVSAELVECTRDRRVLRGQLALVQRTLLGLIPAGERRTLARRIQELEIEDDDAAVAAS